MRILFVDNVLISRLVDVDNPYHPFDLQPQLGLLSLIAVAEQGGHEALLYDPKLGLANGSLSLDGSLYQAIAEEVLNRNPDVVGLTSLGCNFICAVKVAGCLKQMRPDLPILLGGPHATILDREIIGRFTQFDIIVRNEAESILLPLLDCIPRMNVNKVPGITFRRGGEVVVKPGSPLIDDLDALPRAAYHHYPIKELNLTMLRVEAGRGCPFHCTFCSTASFFGRKYRLKSPSRLCDELDYLNQEFGISHFGLMHDLFTVSRAKVRAFCDEVEGRGYTWSCSARMDCVDDELLERMHDAGCRAIYYGVETGSARMQKIVEKNQDLSLFTPILDVTQRLGMAATASFITGYPQEEQADQDDTLDMIGSCFGRPQETLRVDLHLLTPEPGTGLISKFADSLAYDGHITDFNFPTLQSDDSEVMERNPLIFMNHHYYRSVLPRRRHVFVSTLFETLHSLGFPFLDHLLGCCGGKLSRLTARMYERAESIGVEVPNDLFLCEFIEETWGKEHYLSSLVRYMTTASRLFKEHAAREAAMQPGLPDDRRATPKQRGAYVLSPRAVLMRGIHNCPGLLALIAEEKTPGATQAAGATYDDPLYVGRGNYLLFLENARDKAVRNFEVSQAGADMCEFLMVPRTYSECRDALKQKLIGLRGLKGFLEGMVRTGIVAAVKQDGSAFSARASGR